MNGDRIRDQFSAIKENALDEGLLDQFRSKIETNSELQAEYQAFEDLYQKLDDLKEETIEVPANLSTLIATRIEASNEKKSPGWLNIFRPILVGGVVCTLLLGTFSAIRNSSEGPVQSAIIIDSNSVSVPLDQVRFAIDQNAAVFKYRPSGPRTILVKSLESGSVIKSFEVEQQELACPLENPLESATSFDIQVTGTPEHTVFIVPGKSTEVEQVGSGSIVDFAKVLAQKYRTFVSIQISAQELAKPSSQLTWDISNTDLNEAIVATISQNDSAQRLYRTRVVKNILEISSNSN